MTPERVVIDFETKPIRQRPEYPPVPVGWAIKWPGQHGRYWGFGHPTNNSCTYAEAMEELDRAWQSGLPMLFHNAKFDVGVAVEGGGLRMPDWREIHDSMFLAYLCDPHARSLGLKELAADLLQWPPEEKDELADWIMENSAMLLARYPENKSTPNQKKITKTQVGAWIWTAPGDIAGRYAVGDVERTDALFAHLWPIVQEHGMGGAYDRERQVLPIFMENELIGMRMDLEGLGADLVRYDTAMADVEDAMRHFLQVDALNFDADADVADVLLTRGIVPEANWQLTKSGKLSTSKVNLRPEHFTGQAGAEVASALGYRNRLKTCLEMFMRPWLEQASKRNGYVSTNWNQVRNPEGGTRTGRPSTQDPNFLNISKKWLGRDDGYLHPAFLNLPELPLVRAYVLPDAGEVFLHRDFDGQELRIFGHFEQGELWRAYHANPELDVHGELVGPEIMRVAQREIERTKIKTLNFQGIYGGGVPALQAALRCSFAEAKELKAFHKKALPGLAILNEEIKRIVGRGDPIRTWGGRLYWPETPGFSKKYGRHMTYEYKLVNYVVQGSAADLTKQALIEWHQARERRARFLVTVYDEINISSDPGYAVRDMTLLKEVMELPRLSVPMLSSPKHGATWGAAAKCKKETGCALCH